MVQEKRKVSRCFNSSRLLRYCATAALMGAYIPLAFAQGGETEVQKTRPSDPPAVAAPAAPAMAPAPAPAPAAAAPAASAQKPASPMGAGTAWQAKPQQSEPAPVPAPEPAVLQESDQVIVTKINDYFNNLTDLQGEFIQTDPDTKQRHGKFYFQRPGKARFDYAPPSGLRIISDGSNLVIEDHDLNTSERYPLDVTPFKLILSDKVDLANDAHILSVEQGPDMFIISVEEKGSTGSGRIRLFFNKADTSLKEWIITDAQGLDTRIEVSNIELNKKISENYFIISAFGLGRD